MNDTHASRFGLDRIARFFSELRRRKVIKVAGAYAIVGWLVIQIGSNTFEALHLPPWALTLVIVLTALGFPIALVIAWSVELTPRGIRAEQAASPEAAAPSPVLPGSAATARSALVAQPLPRRSRVVAPEKVSTPLPAGAVPAARVAATQLRHDLRTPLNAILGYSEVLVTEAAELGMTDFLPELQRLHDDAKRVLDRINEAVPANPSAGAIAGEDIRIGARDRLLEPSRMLLAQTQALRAKAGEVEAARADLDRLLAAVTRLASLVEGLTSGDGAKPVDPGRETVESTLNRLHPQAAERADASGAVLVVDDNASNRDLVTRQLVREGYDVLAVSSGREALDTLRLREFDLVLLDVVMPEMDGVQLLEQLQADGTLADIPVIMMSALDEIGAVARCLEKGASDYLTKPCDPVLLRARVRSTLQIRHLRDDLRHAEQRLDESATAMQQLTRSIVPQPLAPSFAGADPAAPIQYPEVSAVVVRFEGVDAIAARMPGETTRLLTPVFEALEQCSAESGLTLTRMTDRTFTAIAGAPQWSDNHAQVAADLALRLRETFATLGSARPQPLQLRIGVHCGLLTVGLAGDRRLVFGLWGDAVTTAEAIAACAPLGRIQLSNAACTKLGGRFELDSPLVIEVPGRGRLPTRALKARLNTSARPGGQ